MIAKEGEIIIGNFIDTSNDAELFDGTVLGLGLEWVVVVRVSDYDIWKL